MMEFCAALAANADSNEVASIIPPTMISFMPECCTQILVGPPAVLPLHDLTMALDDKEQNQPWESCPFVK
ncbi:MAG: hypothetical protein KGI33_04720 [Thaumarchaeota archaeon]|nr:hypothetical protein [Nitrososphaerota archaeon]